MTLNNCYQDLTVTGSVVGVDLDKPSFSIRARSGDVFEAVVGPTIWYEVLTNLDNLGHDWVLEPEDTSGDGVRDSLKKYIQLNRPVTVEGVIYKNGEQQEVWRPGRCICSTPSPTPTCSRRPTGGCRS